MDVFVGEIFRDAFSEFLSCSSSPGVALRKKWLSKYVCLPVDDTEYKWVLGLQMDCQSEHGPR